VLYCEGRAGGDKHKRAPSSTVRHTLDMRSQGEGKFVPVFATKAHGSGGIAPPNPDIRSRAVTSSNLYCRGEEASIYICDVLGELKMRSRRSGPHQNLLLPPETADDSSVIRPVA